MQHARIQKAVGCQLPYPAVEQQGRGERKVAENKKRHARGRVFHEQQHKKHSDIGQDKLAGNPAKARE